MASELKLSGTNARVILQGNDTISSDQTFTFPDSGGEVLTGSGNTDNTGSGGSSGSAEVVGFQQGEWTPVWTQGITTSYVNTGGFWSRIGNTVFFTGRIQGSGGSTTGDVVRMSGFPYVQAAGLGSGCVNIGYGGALFGSTVNYMGLFSSNSSFIRFSGNNGNLMVGTDVSATNATCHFSGFYHTTNTDWTPINGATVS